MDNWYKFYWWIVDDNKFGKIGKALNRFVRIFVKRHLDSKMKSYFINNPIDVGVNKSQNRKRKLICSMTSFPARIDEVWICLETIFRQTLKADEIVLWLSKEQFEGIKLPESLINCEKKGLTIRWVDEDLRSHKKYYYALQEYVDADIVLLDDDLYYPDNLLENLIEMSNQCPNTICATRVHKMTFNGERICPYGEWIHNFNPKDYSSKNLFFTSGAGTLIPTGIMPNSIFQKDVFKRICFLADDVWLNMHAVKAGIKVVSNSTFDKDEIAIGNSQCVKLVSQNVISGGNDSQIKAVMGFLEMTSIKN